jgi:hypothetical protein
MFFNTSERSQSKSFFLSVASTLFDRSDEGFVYKCFLILVERSQSKTLIPPTPNFFYDCLRDGLRQGLEYGIIFLAITIPKHTWSFQANQTTNNILKYCSFGGKRNEEIFPVINS